MNLKALAMAALVLLFVSCANSPNGPDMAGSGSESPNALTGTVLSPMATAPEQDAEVLLYQVTETRGADSGVDYAWALSDSTHTDANGRFILDSIRPGSYTLIFQKNDRKAFSGYFNIEESDDTVTCIAVLEPTQTIRGTIRDTADTVSREFTLGLVGTPYFDTVTTADSFTFAGIPAGKYKWDIRSEVIRPPIRNSVLFADSSIFTYAALYAVSSVYFVALPSADSLAGTGSAEPDSLPDLPWWGWEIDAVGMSVAPTENKIQLTDESYIIEYTVTENP